MLKSPEYIVGIHQSGLVSSPESEEIVMSPDALLRNRAGLARIKDLETNGRRVKAVFLGGGEVYAGYPPLHDFAECYLRENGLPSEIPIEKAETFNTLEDVDALREAMRRLNITKGICISNSSHLSAKTYSWLSGLRNTTQHLDFEDAESILRRFFADSPTILSEVEAFEKSKANQTVTLNQLALSGLLLTPIIGPNLYRSLSRKTLSQRARLT